MSYSYAFYRIIPEHRDGHKDRPQPEAEVADERHPCPGIQRGQGVHGRRRQPFGRRRPGRKADDREHGHAKGEGQHGRMQPGLEKRMIHERQEVGLSVPHQQGADDGGRDETRQHARRCRPIPEHAGEENSGEGHHEIGLDRLQVCEQVAEFADHRGPDRPDDKDREHGDPSDPDLRPLATNRAEALQVLQQRATEAFRESNGLKRPTSRIRFSELSYICFANTKHLKAWMTNEYRLKLNLVPF